MKKHTMFIKKHSVLSYFALTFAVSWGGFIALFGFSGISGSVKVSMQSPLFLSAVFVTLLGPFVSGIFMTLFMYGKKGFQDLLSRFFRLRGVVKWYLVAFLAAPITVFGTLFVLATISPAFIPGIVTADNKLAFILPILVISIISPIFEETGWSGFVMPEVRKRYSILATGIIVGVIWGLWHGLSNLWFVGTANGSVPLFFYMSALLFSFLPPFRILMVWLYDNTKSLFLVYLMHVSLDFFWLLATPAKIAGGNLVMWYLSWAVVLWITVVVVAVANHLQFSIKPLHKLASRFT